MILNVLSIVFKQNGIATQFIDFVEILLFKNESNFLIRIVLCVRITSYKTPTIEKF